MDLDRLMDEQNPWWRGRKDPHLTSDLIGREFAQEFLDGLRRHYVDVVVGVRRVGKTVLLHQAIAHLLSAGVDSRSILFFQFEETSPRLGIAEVLNRYFDVVLKGSPSDAGERVFLLLDEVQAVPEWSGAVKRYRDLNPQRIKVVVSGSHARMIMKSARESLAGRVTERTVPVFSFAEYNALMSSTPATTTLRDVVSAKGRQILKELEYAHAQDGADLAKRFLVYLSSGQFPEVARDRVGAAHQYVAQKVVERVVKSDLPSQFGEEIGKPRTLADLYGVLAEEGGNALNLTNVSSELGINVRTLSKYLGLLQQAFLVRPLSNWHRSARESFRLAHKSYVGSAGLYAAHHRLSADAIASSIQGGFLFEHAAFDRLQRDQAVARDAEGPDIRYWRERDKEIDFLVTLERTDDSGEARVPIEVKSGRVRLQELSGLRHAMRLFDSPVGLVLTRDLFGEVEFSDGSFRGTIRALPLWLLG